MSFMCKCVGIHFISNFYCLSLSSREYRRCKMRNIVYRHKQLLLDTHIWHLERLWLCKLKYSRACDASIQSNWDQLNDRPIKFRGNNLYTCSWLIQYSCFLFCCCLLWFVEFGLIFYATLCYSLSFQILNRQNPIDGTPFFSQKMDWNS